MSIDLKTPVGDIVTEDPRTAAVFQRYGIDFCCHGGESLGAAVEGLGLSIEEVLEALKTAGPAAEPELDMTAASTPELIDHLLERYHGPTWPQVESISQMMDKVTKRHSETYPDRVPQLSRAWSHLASELTSHYRKEEVILFPAMLQLCEEPDSGVNLGGPLHVMLTEHDEAGRLLNLMRDVTGGYVAPDGACRTTLALHAALGDFDAFMRRHIHLENYVLFPRYGASAHGDRPSGGGCH